MMPDWDGQVVCAIWGEHCKNEDHVVPYPKGTEGYASNTFEDYYQNQLGLRPTNRRSGANNSSLPSNLENKYSSSTNEGLSGSRLDLEMWPDFPALDAAFSNGCSNKNHQNPTTTEVTNYLGEAPMLNRETGKMAGYDHSTAVLQCSDASAQKGTCSTVQRDGESELFNNDNFLDYDWDNIGDFDDPYKVFRNDFSYGHDMVGKGAEVFSSCTTPVPDVLSIMDQSSDQDPSFQLVGHYGRKRKMEEKTANSSVGVGDQIVYHTHLSGEYQCRVRHFTEKDDEQIQILKPEKIAKEKNKSAKNGDCSDKINREQQFQSTKMHLSVKSQTPQSRTISLRRQVRDVNSIDHLSCNESMLSGFEYSALQIPAYPLIPNNHAERNQIKPVPFSRQPYPDFFGPSNYSAKLPDVPSRLFSMTPQEKIEKLRRRQQMQAFLAIQKQQQQFVQQTIGTDNLLSQACLQKKPILDDLSSTIEHDVDMLLSSDRNVLIPHEESQSFPLSNYHTLEETIYYQLQDTLGKLDIGARLCIRDSLFRLAKSAEERENITDRSSTSKDGRDEILANEVTNNRNRCMRLQDIETDTNFTDRTVARLLFYTDSCAKREKEEIPQPPASGNPESGSSLWS